jgi:hypothetical protein
MGQAGEKQRLEDRLKKRGQDELASFYAHGMNRTILLKL